MKLRISYDHDDEGWLDRFDGPVSFGRLAKRKSRMLGRYIIR
jgi:hypothetical protein